ncbi:MAG: DUF4157 domain-containing protein [Syntrophothermus sp.]
MTKERIAGSKETDEKKSRVRKPENLAAERSSVDGSAETASSLVALQQNVGNRAVQRLVAQRSGDAPFELDDQTAARIHAESSSGQVVDEGAQQRMQAATGHDFRDVKVHTSPEANSLNQQIGAKAFTTGRDIYFREGAYSPNTSEGQELLAHEMTHVVQQSSGAVSGGTRMTVNAPGDVYEQEANAVAKSVQGTGGAAAAGVQREAAPEEEEEVQAQAVPEEEEEVQMQEVEEEQVQAQEMEEEEEPGA